jgi:undecaprenyl-diphosphatase
MEWLRSLLLGVVQGVTEFLPVSSDGHLSLLQILTAGPDGQGAEAGKENLFFNVMLHLGTAAAIVVHYGKQVRAGARGFLGATDVPENYRRDRLIRLGILVVVATSPLIPYVKLKPLIEEAIQSLTAVGIGFLVTAGALLLTSRLRGGDKGPGEMTWLDALLIGVAQAFAPMPGVSRSGLTIATALMLGLSRSWAVQFSLLMAVPAIAGASLLELKDVDPSTLTADFVARTLAATIVAGLVGYAAIVGLVRVVRAGRFWYFSVYLVVLGCLALGLAFRRGDRPDAGNASVVDRAERLGPGRAGVAGGPARPDGALDRPEPVRP